MEEFRPSSTFRDSIVRSIVVEWKTLKLCFVGERGIYVVIVLRINFFRILTGFLNNEICRCDEGSVGFLFGFSMGMIFSPVFWSIVMR